MEKLEKLEKLYLISRVFRISLISPFKKCPFDGISRRKIKKPLSTGFSTGSVEHPPLQRTLYAISGGTVEMKVNTTLSADSTNIRG